MKNFTDNRGKKPKFDSPMDAAMRYLVSRARSVREMERYLDGLDYGEVEIMDTVERLKELSLLGDERFARDFIESRLRTKPVSRAHLKEQLRAHEVDADAALEALSVITDELERENAYLAAKSVFPDEGIPDDGKSYDRLLARLMRHGYGYYDSRTALDRCVSEYEEETRL